MSASLIAGAVGLNSSGLDVQTLWERFSIGPGYVRSARAAQPCKVDVPVILRIDFAADLVWMVAALPRAPEMREAFAADDEIMIVFTMERIRRLGFPDSGFLTIN